MKVYGEHLELVKSVAEKLKSRVSEAESRLSAFRDLTTDVIERIKTFGAEHFLHYVKLWFRTFLGMRDECMILITGEIVRSYHIELHREYLHERDREAHYYNNECSLSMCSTDGLDFEYRILQKKYGSKSVFDPIADMSEGIGRRLHDLFKAINACHDRLESFIKSLKICKYDADLARFCAENINIAFAAGEERKKVNLSGQAYRKCKKSQALSTVVEDPPNVTIAPMPRSSNEQVYKKAKLCVDLEDSDEDSLPLPPVKAEPSALMDLDFQFTASLEQIKNAYNPPPESATSSDRVLGTAESASSVSPQSITLSYSRTTTFCLDSPETVLARVVVINPLSNTTTNPQDNSIKEHVHLTLPMQHVYQVLDSKVRGKVVQQLLAADLLDEITKLLWLTPLQCADSKSPDSVKLEQCNASSSENCRIWLPKFVQVEKVKYARGSAIPVPESLGTKRFLVICEPDAASMSFCQSIHKWIHHDYRGNFIKGREQVLNRQRVAVYHKDYLVLLARFLRKVALDPNHSLHLSNQFSPCSCSAIHEDVDRKLCHGFKVAAFQNVISNASSKISSYQLGSDDFVMLCRYCESVSLEATGLNAATVQTYLRSLSAYMTSLPDNVLDYQWRIHSLTLCGPNVLSYLNPVCNHSSYTELTSLIEESMSIVISSTQNLPLETDIGMMVDVMLEALDDRQWRDPWSDVVECVCVHSPQLTKLSFENLTSNNFQLLVLIVGIVRAMQRRQEVTQQETAYVIDASISETEGASDILHAARTRLAALASSSAAHVFTISIRNRAVEIPSLLDISM